jgi:hypothetical protein
MAAERITFVTSFAFPVAWPRRAHRNVSHPGPGISALMQHLPTQLRCGEVGAPMTLSTAKYLLTAIGLVLLLGSLVVCDHTASFVRRAVRTQGTVMALVPHQTANYSNNGTIDNGLPVIYSYQPVVRFRVGPQYVLFSDSVATSPPAHHVGETVTVLYLESNPYNARIESFTSLWLLPLIFGSIGTIFLAVGVRMSVGSRAGRDARTDP